MTPVRNNRFKNTKMGQQVIESQNIEFKSNWRDEYIKAICAFANADGGKLIIGIDDKGDFKFKIKKFEGDKS